MSGSEQSTTPAVDYTLPDASHGRVTGERSRRSETRLAIGSCLCPTARSTTSLTPASGPDGADHAHLSVRPNSHITPLPSMLHISSRTSAPSHVMSHQRLTFNAFRGPATLLVLVLAIHTCDGKFASPLIRTLFPRSLFFVRSPFSPPVTLIVSLNESCRKNGALAGE